MWKEIRQIEKDGGREKESGEKEESVIKIQNMELNMSYLQV